MVELDKRARQAVQLAHQLEAYRSRDQPCSADLDRDTLARIQSLVTQHTCPTLPNHENTYPQDWPISRPMLPSARSLPLAEPGRHRQPNQGEEIHHHRRCSEVLLPVAGAPG